MSEANQHSSPTRQRGYRGRLNWVYWAIVFSICHGLLVWWSMTNASHGFWIMEGGSETLVESLAEILVFILNFPTILVCLILGSPPLTFASPGFLFTNSCLWGICLSLYLNTFTKRPNMKDGLPESSRKPAG